MLHMATPAVPPAIIIAPRLSWEGSDPAGVNAFLATSYAAKYLFAKMARTSTIRHCIINNACLHRITHAALPGPSLARVAPVPRKMLRTPPSRYKTLKTSHTPLYFCPEPCPCTCRSTLARSTGAATSVVGTAERKPAAASSDMLREGDLRFGVTVYIRFLEKS